MDTLAQPANMAAAPAPEMDTDALLADVYGKDASQTAETSSSTQVQDQKNTDPEVEFTWKGKPQKMLWSKAKQYAQKGYDYEQNIFALKKEREEFTKEKTKFGDPQRLAELSKLDEFSRQNPDFLELVRNEWLKRTSGQVPPTSQTQATPAGTTPNDPLHATVQALAQTVNDLKNERDQTKFQQADAELDKDLTGLKETFKYLDWEASDDFGFNREHRLLRHIQNHGVDPKQAFWSLYGEEVAKYQAEKATEKAISDIQEKHKRGKFIGNAMNRSPAFSPKKDLSNQSYDDITSQVMKEHNINY